MGSVREVGVELGVESRSVVVKDWVGVGKGCVVVGIGVK